MPIPTEAFAKWLGVLAALVALGVTTLSAAQSQAPRASLVVTRSEGAQDCPDAVALAEQVRAIAGSDVLGARLVTTPIETWIQVAVARDFSGYKVQIAAFGRHHGARTLEDLGPGCASLADAIAVTLAIFLDPYASSPSAAPAPPPRAAAPPRPAPKAHVQRARPWLPRLTLDAAAGIGVSLLEHSEPLLTGNIGVRFDPRWSLAAGGTFVFPDTKSTGSGDVTLKLSYAYLLGCGRALGNNDGTRLDWCAAPLLGSLGGTGKNYQHNSSGRSVWLAIAAGPRVVFPFSRTLAWVLGGQGVVPLVRQGFDAENKGVRSNLYRSTSVAGLISLGIRGEL